MYNISTFPDFDNWTVFPYFANIRGGWIQGILELCMTFATFYKTKIISKKGKYIYIVSKYLPIKYLTIKGKTVILQWRKLVDTSWSK